MFRAINISEQLRPYPAAAPKRPAPYGSLLGSDAGETYVAVDETFVTRRKYEAGRTTGSMKQTLRFMRTEG